MSELKKMHYISIIWGAILLTLVVGLTIVGLIYKNNSQKYKEAEQNLETKVKQYVEQKFLYPEDDKTITITLKDLQENAILDKLSVEEDECDGYVKVFKKNGVFNYTPYIKCPKYKTKNYEKNN